MHSQAVRSVIRCGRSDATLSRQSLRTCLRPFSTTQWRPEENPGSSSPKPPQPTRAQRSAAAASELGSLNRSSPSPSRKPIDARSLTAPRSGNTPPNVISVRSLPIRREGGDGSRPLVRRTAAGGTTAFNPLKSQGTGGGPGGFRPRLPGQGGPRPAGARAGGPIRGRGGAKTGGRRTGGRRKRRGGDEDGYNGKEVPYTPEEQAYLDAVEQGVDTAYNPTTSLESLAEFLPNMPIRSKLLQIELTTREGEGLKSADEQTRKEYLAAAVGGKHEAPRFAQVSDTLATMTNQHMREKSYTDEDVTKFDEKVKSLLPVQAAKGPKQKQARA